jgi:hypothetical protein
VRCASFAEIQTISASTVFFLLSILGIEITDPNLTFLMYCHADYTLCVQHGSSGTETVAGLLAVGAS